MAKQVGWIRAGFVLLAAAIGACYTVPAPQPTQPTVTTPVTEPTRVVHMNGQNEGPTEPVPPPEPARNPELDSAAYRARALEAQQVLNFNEDANFGGGELVSGFEPDPWAFPLTAGGGRDFIDIKTLGLIDEESGEPCGQAYVTRKPDFHFTLTDAGQYPLVRFWVVTDNEADATLLINDPSGRWRCNDDHGHADWGVERAPAVDFYAPESGRYDIWVGTYEQSAHNPANLYVTELESNHP
ncbi:MAG: hypothetical protein HY905_12300 [Deltaproteobacteria bacterium]|nr:hypothetical protein [Deltaproteobacteria bacterium]